MAWRNDDERCLVGVKVCKRKNNIEVATAKLNSTKKYSYYIDAGIDRSAEGWGRCSGPVIPRDGGVLLSKKFEHL